MQYPLDEKTPSAARFFAGLFAVLFVLLAALSVFDLLAERLLLRPTLYQSAFETEGFYDRFPEVVAEQAKARGMFKGNPMFRYLDDQAMDELFRELFPPEWVRTQTESAINGLFSYMNEQSAQPVMPVSLAEVKARAQGEQGRAMVEKMLLSWPDCSAQQLLALMQMSSLEDFPVCKPPEFLRPTTISILQGVMFSPVIVLPDQMDLAGPLRAASGLYGIEPVLDRGLGTIRTIRRWLRYSLYLAIGALLLVTIFGVRSIRSWLYWWGVPTLAAGLLTAVLTLLLLLGLAVAMQLTANSLASSPAPLLGSLLRSILGYIGLRYLLLTALAAGILTLIGTLLAWISWRMGAKRTLTPE